MLENAKHRTQIVTPIRRRLRFAAVMMVGQVKCVAFRAPTSEYEGKQSAQDNPDHVAGNSPDNSNACEQQQAAD
jgi:hypothetical protein